MSPEVSLLRNLLFYQNRR